MSIDVQGKNCRLWIKKHESKNGEWNSYTVGVSKKDMDGNYMNAYQDVQFTRNANLPEDVQNGAFFDFEGWMGVKTRKDRDGKETKFPVIVINKASFREREEYTDSFAQVDADIPF